QEIDRLELRFSQAAATFAKTTFWDDEGSNSALDWIRFNCRMTSNAAADRLTVGDRLANLGRSAQTMESGEIGFAHLAVAVRTALEPLARPSGEHDDRNREQRYADAIVELAGGGKPANIQVTATIETLKGLAGATAAEMEFSLPISSTSVQRMACDCSVTRVLLSQESVTIDVGRSKRVVSGGLSRALKARDGS